MQSHKKTINNKNQKKDTIPRALREQVWIQNIGQEFEHKCTIDWCQNKMNVFDYHVGHNIPESKGGKTNIKNLKPICARCNLSMGNRYTITEWTKMGNIIKNGDSSMTDSKINDPTISYPAIKKEKSPWWICC